ncbi:MAG: hypothetical protein RLZZ338_1290 [Cyanobacteriota bacterium]|jgi:hypothetical protein
MESIVQSLTEEKLNEILSFVMSKGSSSVI